MAASDASPSAERYLVGSIVFAFAFVGLLAQVPSLAFGTYWRMLSILLVADLALYILVKAGVVRLRAKARSG